MGVSPWLSTSLKRGPTAKLVLNFKLAKKHFKIKTTLRDNLDIVVEIVRRVLFVAYKMP